MALSTPTGHEREEQLGRPDWHQICYGFIET